MKLPIAEGTAYLNVQTKLTYTQQRYWHGPLQTTDKEDKDTKTQIIFIKLY